MTHMDYQVGAMNAGSLGEKQGSLFRMDSRLYNLLPRSFRDLPQTVFVIAECFASQEEEKINQKKHNIKKYTDDTAK